MTQMAGPRHRRVAAAPLGAIVMTLAACSGNGSENVTFTVTGETCSHDGGTEMYRRPVYNLANESDRKAGIELWTVPTGTTATDMPSGVFAGREPEGLVHADPDTVSSGGTTFEHGTTVMVDCFFDDVPADDGLISRFFFDIPEE